MKRLISNLRTGLAATIALGFVSFAAPALAATTVKATVNGMVCAFCAQGIEKRLSKLPAAQAVFVDLKARVVAVEAKPGQTIAESVVSDEIKESGYDVVKLETLQRSVEEIRAESKARR